MGLACRVGVKGEGVGRGRLVVGRGRTSGEVVGRGRGMGCVLKAVCAPAWVLGYKSEAEVGYNCSSSYLEERELGRVAY